ncbi:MAG: hypothetical protein R6X27_16505, partial [Candidatus Desulfacyla sp.]
SILSFADQVVNPAVGETLPADPPGNTVYVFLKENIYQTCGFESTEFFRTSAANRLDTKARPILF